jgi:hypothetical protein
MKSFRMSTYEIIGLKPPLKSTLAENMEGGYALIKAAP